MARRCACERLLEFWETDPRFALAGAAAASIWLRLVRAVQRMGDGSVLRFGSVVGSVADIAIVIRTRETELEPALNRLLELGLLSREADDALAVPWLVDGAMRANAARTNGLRGGRPRRGETAQQAAERKQGHLALPLPGGRIETQETERKPKPESSCASIDSKNPSSSLDAREVYALVEDCAGIARMDPARGGYDGSFIRMWLGMGATPDLIRETVRLVRSRTETVIGGFKYFDGAVREAMKAEASLAPVSARQESSPWADALDAHIAKGGSPERFPSPSEWRAQQQAA